MSGWDRRNALRPPTHRFIFVDLFAGIGGFRIGLENAGGRCVFSSEWDRHAQATYHAWHGALPRGDLTSIHPADIPDHDLLAAGFPCQPFSLAGIAKRNSLDRPHGFECQTQGTLFFRLAAIIRAKRPAVLLLENVKNLRFHNDGRTWESINMTLRKLGYVIFFQIIDAQSWVPQHRERLFIVGFDRTRFGDDPLFVFPPPPNAHPQFRSILEPNPHPRYTLSDRLWDYLQDYARRQQAKGNGFGYGLTDLDGISHTLSARYGKDGSEILIPQPDRNPRRLTPREAARLMGFSDLLPIVVSDTQAYIQFGNSIVPGPVEAIARQIVWSARWLWSRVHW